MRPRLYFGLSLVLVIASAGCKRDEIVNVDPDAAPGQSVPTYEALLDASTLNAWIDTVYPGFASAATAH